MIDTELEVDLDYTCGDSEELVTVIEDICNRGGSIQGIKRRRGRWPQLIVNAPYGKMERILLEYCGGDTAQAEHLLEECFAICGQCNRSTKIKKAYVTDYPSGGVTIDGCAQCEDV